MKQDVNLKLMDERRMVIRRDKRRDKLHETISKETAY